MVERIVVATKLIARNGIPAHFFNFVFFFLTCQAPQTTLPHQIQLCYTSCYFSFMSFCPVL